MTTIKIERICKECNKLFMAPKKEVNRGNGNFCSLSCATKHRNKLNAMQPRTVICMYCGTPFETAATIAKYCSDSCKTANANKHRNSTREHHLKRLPCEVCGWKEASRDLHHIVSLSKGGTDTTVNLISLCPNHHRLADRGLLTQIQLNELVATRS